MKKFALVAASLLVSGPAMAQWIPPGLPGGDVPGVPGGSVPGLGSPGSIGSIGLDAGNAALGPVFSRQQAALVKAQVKAAVAAAKAQAKAAKAAAKASAGR